jgi:molybdate transport system substrate-binding protein
MAVKAGASKPDVSTVEKLKQVLLAAKSIAYSASTSGIYLSSELFPKLGIMNQIRNKTLEVPASAGRAVATGKAEIGFQQIGELLPVRGIDIIRGLPTEVQRITVFAAAIPVTSKHPEAAKALIHWLASPECHAVIRESGFELPVPKTVVTAP